MKNKEWHLHFNNLPESIQSVLKIAASELQPKEIILFGSRARGTHRENSDFDIAFKKVGNQDKWTEFLVNMEERPLSLYALDLVQYEQLGSDYKENILKDGLTLYG